MQVESIDWAGFRSIASEFAALPLSHPARSVIFRGQRDARWRLEATLDRCGVAFATDVEREDYFKSLLQHFRHELRVLGAHTSLPDGEALELLARHHGLPSKVLDWTKSPYIASYFAFEGAVRQTGDVAVWGLIRSLIPQNALGRVIDVIDDSELLDFNPRALQQRGLFTRVVGRSTEFEKELDAALFCYKMPASDAVTALRELDIMTINGTQLFRDTDGAARTAATRNLIDRS